MPSFALNLAIVSFIHFWMPTASVWPHHHILMFVAAGRPKAFEARRYGASPAAAEAPPASFSRSRRESGRCAVSMSSSSCWDGPSLARVDDAADAASGQVLHDLGGRVPREVLER